MCGPNGDESSALIVILSVLGLLSPIVTNEFELRDNAVRHVMFDEPNALLQDVTNDNLP